MKKLVVLVLSGKLFFFEIIEWKIEHLCALNVGKQSKPPLFDFMVAKNALTFRSRSNEIKCIQNRLKTKSLSVKMNMHQHEQKLT